jgi:hypothetical protein
MSALDEPRHEQIVERVRRNIANVAALHPGLERAVPTYVTWDHERTYRHPLHLPLDGIERRIDDARQSVESTGLQVGTCEQPGTRACNRWPRSGTESTS